MSDPQYPHGKLNDDDEGALQLLVYTEENNVVINFGKPVVWVAMPPANIRELAALLLKRADELDQ
jgi:hypothetical protein